MDSEATDEPSNAWKPRSVPKEMEFRLQPRTAIAARALATAEYWYFDEAIFILAGWYAPPWAFSVCFYIDADPEPISQMSLRFEPAPPVEAELPPDVWGVARLYYLSWFNSLPEQERQRLKKQIEPKRGDDPFAPRGEPNLVFHPKKARPKEWLNWANECLLDALPVVLRSLVTTETPDERRERMARLRRTMSTAQIAKLEGISPQRVRAITAKREVTNESETASPLRIGQLLARGKPPK